MLLEAGSFADLVGRVSWPFLRLSAAFLAAPFFGAAMMPVTVRILLAAAIAVLVAPLLPPSPSVDPLSLPGLGVAAGEVLVGVAMGFVLALAFSALAQAGEQIALGMGLGFASVNDPALGVSVPLVSQYYVTLGTLVFLLLGGHLFLIGAVVASFTTLPVGGAGIDADGLWRLVSWAGVMFGWAVLVALPAVAALLLVNVAFGVITRAAPQFNMMAVGLPLTILVGLVVMLLTLGPVVSSMEELFAEAFALIERLQAG